MRRGGREAGMRTKHCKRLVRCPQKRVSDDKGYSDSARRERQMSVGHKGRREQGGKPRRMGPEGQGSDEPMMRGAEATKPSEEHSAGPRRAQRPPFMMTNSHSPMPGTTRKRW